MKEIAFVDTESLAEKGRRIYEEQLRETLLFPLSVVMIAINPLSRSEVKVERRESRVERQGSRVFFISRLLTLDSRPLTILTST